MILLSVLLASMTYTDAHLLDTMVNEHQEQQVALAPFPFYFTPLGKTKLEIVESDGIKYVVKWSATRKSATFHRLDEMRVKEPKEFDWLFWGSVGILVVIVSILMWMVVK